MKLACFLLFVSVPLAAQIPPAEKLSTEDLRAMTQEVDHFKQMLPSANDPCSVEFEIARNYSAGGQFQQAMEWLRKVVAASCGFDPSLDKLFAPIFATREFKALVDEVRQSTPPVSSSQPAITIDAADSFTENMAYDPPTDSYFIGSSFNRGIIRCKAQRPCETFVHSQPDGLGFVLGLKIDQRSRTLWTTSNTDKGASLLHFSLPSGKLLGSYPLSGAHLFNDLALAWNGDVFITDTREGSVYKLVHGGARLEGVLPNHEFRSANGIALSSDGSKLFISAFGDGITVVDLAAQTAAPMPHAAGISLGYIDGLYALRGSLIAIQNGPMVPRIVRFSLSADDSRIEAMQILERRNPVFDGLTTGDLVSGRFYFVANSQIDKKDAFKDGGQVHLNPLQIFALKP